MISQIEQEKRLHEKLLALFLIMLKYSNKISPLLSLFKTDRNLIKYEVNNIYAKYTKENKLEITNTEINMEMKKLEPVFNHIGKNLVLKESNVLTSLLYMVYHDTYYRTYYELSKVMKLNVKKLTNSIINDSIKQKIQNKTSFERNRINKSKFINKTSNDIKEQLKKDTSIDVINKTIDKNFNVGAYYSQRLVEDQIARRFRDAQMEIFRDTGIEMVRFSAVMDERTTALCESLDEQIFPLESCPEPPLHLNCRSDILPIIQDYNDNNSTETYTEFMQENDI